MEKTKLNSILSLDVQKEKDLINFLERCRDSRRLGDFVTICVRACWENPKLLEECGYTINSRGLTEERIKYFSNLENELNKLASKIDKIYDMALKVYMLSLMGKKLGIEEQSLNTLKAQFILQKQLNEFKGILGIENTIYESDRVLDVQAKADDMLEFIINSYDGIISELREVRTIAVEKVETQEKDTKEEEIKDDMQLGFDENADIGALIDFLGE